MRSRMSTRSGAVPLRASDRASAVSTGSSAARVTSAMISRARCWKSSDCRVPSTSSAFWPTSMDDEYRKIEASSSICPAPECAAKRAFTASVMSRSSSEGDSGSGCRSRANSLSHSSAPGFVSCRSANSRREGRGTSPRAARFARDAADWRGDGEPAAERRPASSPARGGWVSRRCEPPDGQRCHKHQRAQPPQAASLIAGEVSSGCCHWVFSEA